MQSIASHPVPYSDDIMTSGEEGAGVSVLATCLSTEVLEREIVNKRLMVRVDGRAKKPNWLDNHTKQ